MSAISGKQFNESLVGTIMKVIIDVHQITFDSSCKSCLRKYIRFVLRKYPSYGDIDKIRAKQIMFTKLELIKEFYSELNNEEQTPAPKSVQRIKYALACLVKKEHGPEYFALDRTIN